MRLDIHLLANDRVTFSLAIRRHHCRLCGRIVCSSPQLPQLLKAEHHTQFSSQPPCSSLLVVEPDTYRVKNLPARPGPEAPVPVLRAYKEATSRAIRFCRDCKVVLLRISYRSNTAQQTSFTNHYDALVHLQKEINEALPEFHEMILGLQKKDVTATLASSLHDSRALQADAAQARKELLVHFTRFDQLAKKIRTLKPLVEQQESITQQRLQHAIYTKATMFLQKNMFPLQSLPDTNRSSRSKTQDKKSEPFGANADQIRILTEQDALLRDYLTAATKARNLDDVSALKANREEIRAEIARLKSISL